MSILRFVLLPFRDVQCHATSFLPVFLPLRNRRARLRLLPAIVLCVLLLMSLRWATSSLFAHSIKPLDRSEEFLSATPPRILLVSALFPLAQAKHSHEEYMSWLTNFLGPDGVQTDVYFYTTPGLASLVSSFQLSASTTAPASRTRRFTLNTTYTSPFSIPPIVPYISKYHEMHAWDRERSYHNPELYAVWNAKPWLLDHALRSLSHVQYDYAFWVDAGSFRSPHPFRLWPDPRRVHQMLSGSNKDKVLIPLYGLPSKAEYPWHFEMGPVDMDMSEGSFFGSTPRGISWYTKTFYKTHDLFINTSPLPAAGRFPQWLSSWLSTPHQAPRSPFHFVGKDQTLINAVIFRHPEKFVGVLVPSRVGLLPPPSTPSTRRPSLSPFQQNSTCPPPSPPSTLFEPPIPVYMLTLSTLLARHRYRYVKSCGDWYFYEWFLASDVERARVQEDEWNQCPSGHAEGKQTIFLVDVEGMLRGLFGAGWVEGRRARDEGCP